jgi:hypothetical protein
MLNSARNLFKLIYKIGMIVVTLMLGGVAILAYANSTPGNGLLLVCGILALLTLMAGLSITKLDDQDEQAETYQKIGDEIRTFIQRSTKTVYTEPEVHHVDVAAVERARRMARSGSPIDAICRTIDPNHDSHGPAHREAFRKIVQAMVDN